MILDRTPTLPGWKPVPGVAELFARAGVWSASAWQFGPTWVISALELAEYPDGKGAGPQWHISVTRMGKRPKDHDVRRALRAFGFVGAEEDNHHPGMARNFWIPVDPKHRAECQCKETETVVVEADGYTWTNPTDGSCRGCEFAQLLGRPCPLHPESP